MSRKTAKEFKEEAEAEVFSAMAAEGHIPEGNIVSRLARRFRADPVLLPIVKNKEGPKGRTSLMFAAKQGDLARVRFLLEKGADPTKEDIDFHSVVYYAAVGGNRQILDLLLEHGAELNYQNRWGNTALHYAAAYGNIAAVEFLCAAGIDVNKLNHSLNTALMQALGVSMLVRVRNKPSNETKREIIRILLQAGTDIKIKNQQGSTALSLASSTGNVQAVRLLCEAGSEVNTRDNDGCTPLIRVIDGIQWYKTSDENIEEIIEILLAFRANPDIPDNRRATIYAYINSFVENKELKEHLMKIIADARASGAGSAAEGGGAEGGGAGGGAASRNRKSKKSRRARRKTRKARS